MGVARNAVSIHETEPYLEQAREDFDRTGQKQHLFGPIICGAKSWKLKRAVIVAAEYAEKGANPRLILSSLDGKDQDIYDKIYCAVVRWKIESNSRCSCLALKPVLNVGGKSMAGVAQCHGLWADRIFPLNSS